MIQREIHIEISMVAIVNRSGARAEIKPGHYSREQILSALKDRITKRDHDWINHFVQSMDVKDSDTITVTAVPPKHETKQPDP